MPLFSPSHGPGNALGFTPAKLRATPWSDSSSVRKRRGARWLRDHREREGQHRGVNHNLGSSAPPPCQQPRGRELPRAPSESLLDELLQFADAGGFLLGRGSAQRQRAGAVAARGRRREAQAEKVQHAALLAPLQALRSKGQHSLTRQHLQHSPFQTSTSGSATPRISGWPRAEQVSKCETKLFLQQQLYY